MKRITLRKTILTKAILVTDVPMIRKECIKAAIKGKAYKAFFKGIFYGILFDLGDIKILCEKPMSYSGPVFHPEYSRNWSFYLGQG